MGHESLPQTPFSNSPVVTLIYFQGRTARAGRGGRSCTLIGEGRRHLMKDLIKDAESKVKRNKTSDNDNPNNNARFKSGVIRSRTIPAPVIGHFVFKIESLQSHVDEVLAAEAVAKMDRIAEMEATRAQNIIEHADEIQHRPRKEWFASNKQKQKTRMAASEKQKMIEETAGTGMHRMTRKKRRAREALEALNVPVDEGDGDEGGDDEAVSRKGGTKKSVNIKSSARAQKRQRESKEQEKYEQSIHDIDLAKQQERRRKKKGVVGMDAAGDSSLFAEEKVSYANKKAPKKAEPSTGSSVAQSSYNFRGYDPNKKLGKKKGPKAFKSKAKYKRR